MLICKACWLRDRPEDADEHFSEWDNADKCYEQCEMCQRQTLCAEL